MERGGRACVFVALFLAACTVAGCRAPAREPSSTPPPEPQPPSMPIAPLVRAEPSLALGAAFGCVLRPDAGVSCFGSNRFGQLGTPAIDAGYLRYRAMPEPVEGLRDAIAVAAGDFHACASTPREARCWGHGGYGQLGDGAREDRSRPVAMRGLPEGAAIAGLAAGNAHTCVLARTGVVFCTGANTWGQLGDGTTTDRAELGPVPGIEGTVAIVAGRFHTCALTSRREVLCWGANVDGQCGAQGADSRERVVTPGRVVLPAPTRHLSAGGVRTCAADDEGAIRCFGVDVRRPTELARSPNGIRALTAQTHYVAWLDGDGAPHVEGAWPEQPEGLEGTTMTPMPGAEERLVVLAAGPRHVCGLRTDGALACFGDEADGRLGREPTVAR